MGWNGAPQARQKSTDIASASNKGFLNHDGDDSRFYYVHSFAVLDHVDLSEWVYSWTRYGDQLFVSSVNKGNVFATQFHPEKSGFAGLKVIKSFLELPGDIVTPSDSPCVEGLRDLSEVKDNLSRRIIACLDVRANE